MRLTKGILYDSVQLIPNSGGLRMLFPFYGKQEGAVADYNPTLFWKKIPICSCATLGCQTPIEEE